MKNIEIDASDVLTRLSAELANALQRAVVAEAGRDKALQLLEEAQATTVDSDDVVDAE